MNNVLEELEELEKRLERTDRLEKAGVMASDMIRKHIYRGEGFDPLAPATAAYRGRGQPLQDTSTLRKSIASEMTAADTVSVGTTVRYAPLHNAGGTIRAKKAGFSSLHRGCGNLSVHTEKARQPSSKR